MFRDAFRSQPAPLGISTTDQFKLVGNPRLSVLRNDGRINEDEACRPNGLRDNSTAVA